MEEIVIKLSIDGTNGNVSLQATDAALQKIVKSVGDANKATNTFADNFVRSFQNMRNLGQGFQQAFGMVEGIFGTGIKKAMDYELSIAKLNGVIRSGGKDNEVSVGSMEKFATEMSKSSLHTKQEIIDVQRMFLSFKNIGAGSINEATDAALALTEVLGMDVRGATIALAKALDQGSEGMKALNRMGLKLSKDELEHVKNLEDEGKTYEMQTYILDLLAKKYKDLDAEIQKTDAFKLNQAEKALGEIQKQAGKLQLMAAGPLLTGLGNMLGAFNTLGKSVQGFTVTVAELTIAYGILTSTGIGKSILGIMQMGTSLNTLKIAKLENIIMTGELTAAQQAEALSAYEAATANKGFFASMGPVGWIILGIAGIATAWGLIDSAIKKTEATQSEEDLKLRTQQNDFNRLAGVIRDTTKSETERGDAIKEITNKYPEYLNQSLKQNATEEEKNKILEKGNDLFLQRIKLEANTAMLKKAYEDLGKAQYERDLKKAEMDKENLKQDTEGGYQNKEVTRAVYGAASIKEADYNVAQGKVDEFQKIADDMEKRTRSQEPEEKPEVTAAAILKDTEPASVAGWTGAKMDKYIKRLKDLEPKLVVGSDLQKKVNAREKELSDTRFGKTGGNGLGYQAEDVKLDLEQLDKIKGMYELVGKKWAEISKMQARNGKGVVDSFKSTELQQKAFFKDRDLLEKSIETLMKNKIKSAEVGGEAAGEDRIQISKDKLQVMQQVMEEVNRQAELWNADPKKKDFPVISKQKMNEWKIEVIKTQNEINKETFDAGAKLFSNDEELISKRMDIENAGDLAKVLLKESYLKKELQLAEDFHQVEKAEELRHKLDMNDLEKRDVTKRISERSRNFDYEQQISKATRTYNEFGADTLNEMKNYEEGQQQIKDDPLLNQKQKDKAQIELTEATQQRMHDIKRKYYDAWLGELAGLSKQEIEAISNIVNQVSAAANAFMEMGSRRGQADADNYRKTENEKLDVQKKSALAGARTAAQKQKIEDDYAKKKEKIDEEANKKGQERIKSAFVIQQMAGIASAAISTYKGAAAALEPPPIGAGPVLGPFLMAATIIAGLAQVAAIESQDPPKFATGGMPAAILKYIYRPSGQIEGPGTETSDSILARISKEEFIVNAAATKRHLPWLEQINSNKFSGGGFAGGSSYSSSNFYYPKSDNGELIREMQQMGRRMDNMMDEIARVKKMPAAIGDRECRKIAHIALGFIKNEKL